MGKYARLRQELSLVTRSGREERVCVVTVKHVDNDTSQSISEFGVVAAHTTGGHGHVAFGIPSSLKQALQHENSEYCKAAILDEIIHHEEIFHAFGPPISREAHMKVTPTIFFVFAKIGWIG